MKKLIPFLLLPFFLLAQDVTRTWDDTTLIVENVVVNGLISGVAELEFETVAQMKAFDFSTMANGARIKCNGYNIANDGYFGPDVFWNTASTATDDGFSVFDPVASGAGRLIRSFKEVVNVKWGGAYGNGSTDDTLIIQSVFDSGAKSVYFPEGDYLVTAQTDTFEAITITGVSNLTIDFETGARLIGNPASSIEALVIEGGDDDSYTYSYSNLASNVSKGAVSIVLASGEGTNFEAGDWIKIVSEDILDGPMSTQSKKKGELVRVLSVSTDTLTLATPLHDSYATADTAKCAVAPMVSNITINNFQSNNIWRSLIVRWAENVTITNTNITNQVISTGCGIAINDCVDVKIRDSHLADFVYYGIQVDFSSRDVFIDGIYGSALRHVVTTLANDTYGQVRNLTVRNGKAYNCSLSAWDTHESGENILFENLYSFEDGDHGVQIRAWKALIKDCLIENTNSDSYSVELAESTDVVFSGCISKTAARDGFASKAVDTDMIQCVAQNSVGRGFRSAGGRITECKATGNDAAAVVYNNNATRGPLEIKRMYAPYDAAQTLFLAGGDGQNLDLAEVSVIDCTLTGGYAVNGLWGSGTGAAPYHTGNQIFTNSSDAVGLTTMTSGQAEVLLPELILDTVGGSFHRPVVPDVYVSRVSGYYPTLTFDDTDVNATNEWITGIVWSPAYDFGDGFVYGDNGGSITGLTNTNTYYVARNSFPSIQTMRLTEEYQPTLLDGGFTAAANGASITVNVDDSSSFVIGRYAVFDTPADPTSDNYHAYLVTAKPSGTQLTLQTGSVANAGIVFANNTKVYLGAVLFSAPSGTGFTLTPATLTNGTPLAVVGMAGNYGFLIKSTDASEAGRTIKWRLNY
jgi:hypothetical protein